MSKHVREETHGAILVVCASVLWATGYLFRKTALYGISAVLFNFLGACVVSVVFAIIFRFSLNDVRRSFFKHPWLYLGLSATGVAIGTTCMFIALDHLDLGVTVILERLQPIFTLVLARIFLGERPPLSRWPWACGAFIASYFVSSPNPLELSFTSTSLYGICAVVLAACSWGISSVIGKQLTTVEPDVRMITLLRFVVGAIMLLPVFLLRDPMGLKLELDTYVVSVTIGCAVFSTGGGYIFFYRGLRTISATTSGFLEFVTPIVGAVLGVVFLHERLTVIQVLASLGLLWCIYQITRTRHREA